MIKNLNGNVQMELSLVMIKTIIQDVDFDPKNRETTCFTTCLFLLFTEKQSFRKRKVLSSK